MFVGMIVAANVGGELGLQWVMLPLQCFGLADKYLPSIS
jgi:hypothetical protein